ncbi:MAG: hypothetical protein KZQ66_16475 [Candidatus Thiodiazotropha sp. (ex Lucinoma aequizonata)]|nr:hypothetical protein [Candidatus Thiodiazotropha sp. (ex Lucinoma aequizonata)]MCU7888840.1 hypothetical protein [Candidatus Thiodiazotropha sp. (ex Lucinoma aequizonata)]MCU7894751.1 hypothetical protein [Candidatus Thiodiazotropha sp. (ex Lucinoma aequizonata)]MCU7899399.1 hypothetical protein [Candidatus Thiodiazotropha sp. (ex Lucinoma aequizonata)]MCU7903389.1 hypothetical protein [Candidatus Thiodiazotropha sp. (ex Lucinoma aequizonata)]
MFSHLIRDCGGGSGEVHIETTAKDTAFLGMEFFTVNTQKWVIIKLSTGSFLFKTGGVMMRMKFGLFILVLLVSMKLFAGYRDTANNAGALVVRDASSGELTPHYFKIGNAGQILWFSTPGHDNFIQNVGCPLPTSTYNICHLKLSWLGATVVDWQPYIFVQDDKGKVWIAQRSWDSKTWTWKEVGCPNLNSLESCGKLRGLGATSVDDFFLNEGRRPYLFVTNDKGRVFNLSRDANEAWSWDDMNCPGGKCDKEELEGLGAINMFDYASELERPYLFVIDDNTSKVWNLWRDVNWPDLDGNPWRWSDMKCPNEKCDKKYNGLGYMMQSTMMRTAIENGMDIGNPRQPYVFVAVADNPDEVYYLSWPYDKNVEQKWSWRKLILKNAKQIIGVVPVLFSNEIVPVIVAETKDKKITITHLDATNPYTWFTKKYDCLLCPLSNAIAFSRTHSPNGTGVIIYKSSMGPKQEFKTYWF